LAAILKGNLPFFNDKELKKMGMNVRLNHPIKKLATGGNQFQKNVFRRITAVKVAIQSLEIENGFVVSHNNV
jgi:hypothetical protein